jgi:drug/metabolite transporter (DMT)-like permease
MHLTATQGRLLVLVGVLIVTPDTLLVKLVSCSPATLLFWRQLLSGTAVGFAALILEGRTRLANSLRTYWRETLVNTLIWSVSTASFALAASLAPAATVLVILAAQSLVSAGLGRLILHEQLPLPTLAAIVVGFVAVIIVFAWDVTGASALGYSLAGVCAFLLPLYMVLVRRVSQHHPDAIMLPCLVLGPVGVLPLFALAIGAEPLSPTPLDFLWLCLQGCIVCPLTFIALTLGPRAISAAEVSLMLLLETVLGPIWVWLALGEKPPHGSAIGGSLLLATLIAHSLWALHREHHRRKSIRMSSGKIAEGSGSVSLPLQDMDADDESAAHTNTNTTIARDTDDSHAASAYDHAQENEEMDVGDEKALLASDAHGESAGGSVA